MIDHSSSPFLISKGLGHQAAQFGRGLKFGFQTSRRHSKVARAERGLPITAVGGLKRGFRNGFQNSQGNPAPMMRDKRLLSQAKTQAKSRTQRDLVNWAQRNQ